jgi:hypothetical protein
MAFIGITACITARCSISRSEPYYPGNSTLSKDPNYGLRYNARTRGVALGTFNIDLDAL